jgi:hypothetical protein
LCALKRQCVSNLSDEEDLSSTGREGVRSCRERADHVDRDDRDDRAGNVKCASVGFASRADIDSLPSACCGFPQIGITIASDLSRLS